MKGRDDPKLPAKTASRLTEELNAAKNKLRLEILKNKQLSDELNNHEAFLDRLVRDRTSELMKTNKALRAEIMRRIQTGKELIESQRFINRIADATPDLVYIYDVITSRNIYINQRVLSILGYSHDQLRRMGSSFFETVLHPDDAGVFESVRLDLEKAGYKDTLEKTFRMRNSAGQWRWFSSRMVLFKKTPSDLPHLVLGIAQDCTDRREAEIELNRSREQLRILLAHQHSVLEKERAKISMEIHDELGQSLTALKIDLAWLMKRLTRDQAPLIEKSRVMSDLIDGNIRTVQRISSELRPGLLDHLGLTAALEWQAEEFRKRTTIPCQLSINPGLSDLGKEISTAVFRIFQEALTNVARHAGATRVRVTLAGKDNVLTFTVIDNGRGITPKQAQNPLSIGLTGIRERIHFLGGTFSISGRKNRGTSLKVTIPHGPSRGTTE
ncbi:MAG: PAS domain-containing protein [Nitrospirae bacterium]|nr:PAS domain-containing protein [Nitrospirota bacterium]